MSTRSHTWSAVAGSLLLLAGCGEAATTSPPGSDQSPVTGEQVQQEIGEAARTTGKFAEQKKDEYLQKLNEQLADLEPKIERVKQRADGLAGEAKQRWQQTLADLEQKREEVEAKREELTDAGGDAWRDLKGGLEQAWSDLKQATDEAVNRFDEDAGSADNPPR